MLRNNLYNLMEQMVEESQSLYRIKNDYMKDENECGECMEFWKKMESDKEEHIENLRKLIQHEMERKK